MSTDDRFKQTVIAFQQHLQKCDEQIAEIKGVLKHAKEERQRVERDMLGFIQDETRPILRLQMDPEHESSHVSQSLD